MSPKRDLGAGWRLMQRVQDLQLDHDLRFDIVRHVHLNGEASANSMTQARDVGSRNLPVVSYHVRILRDADVLEVVREEMRRGAIEHYVSLAPWARQTIDAVVGLADGKVKVTR